MSKDQFMSDIELSSELDSLLGGISISNKPNNLPPIQARTKETQTHQDLVIARNNEIRSKLDALRKRVIHDDDKTKLNKDVPTNENLHTEVEILRSELEKLRTQTNKEREQLQESITNEGNDAVSKEIELQAALQAERQQAALMRKALEERDKALEDLTTQCQSLEDDLEDREREMDHLTRKIEQVQADPSTSRSMEILDDRPLVNQLSSHSDISELFQEEKVNSAKGFAIPWQLIGKKIVIALSVGLAGITLILLWPHIYKNFILPIVMSKSTPTVSMTPTIVPTIPPPPSDAETQIKPTPTATPTTETQTPVVIPVPLISEPIRDQLNSGGKGPLMLQIPAKQFFMGSKPLYGGGTERGEQPFHAVNINTFFIAKYETTFEEYDTFANATGRALPDDAGFGRANRPVININWEDAQDYVKWLSSETGQHYYLPSEAQWEYAAKGGSVTRYWWGNTVQKGQAICFACGTEWDSRSTAPVGSLKPNAFGLYDTAGNVMEWLQDCYNIDYTNAPKDGSPWLTGDCSQHSVRSGAFNKPMSMTRNTARFKLPIESRFNMLGMRVARD